MVNLGTIFLTQALLLQVVLGNFVITGHIEEKSERWAVLVAGSDSWSNYRHQADVCHAYQVLHQHGIPDTHIIVMMVDDIAMNPENKYKGLIINRPYGPDVYGGVVKDYTGYDVTVENFLNVMMGNASAMAGIGSGKVLKSGRNDKVFLNLVDHGGFGMFCFPNSYLYGRQFVNTLIRMHEEERFKEMVIYVESCESGSLFQNLLPDYIKVYALTASSPDKSSYACYFDDILQNYIGDLFSVKWMEDTDYEDSSKETFEEQFEIVYSETSYNETPSRYGDFSLEMEVTGQFFGESGTARKHRPIDVSLDRAKRESTVESHAVPMSILEKNIEKATTEEEKSKFQEELIRLFKNRKSLENIVEEIVLRLTWSTKRTKEVMTKKPTQINDWDCYELTTESFHHNCFNLGQSTYALRFVSIFSTLCDSGFSAKAINKAIISVCDYPSTINVL